MTTPPQKATAPKVEIISHHQTVKKALDFLLDELQDAGSISDETLYAVDGYLHRATGMVDIATAYLVRQKRLAKEQKR